MDLTALQAEIAARVQPEDVLQHASLLVGPCTYAANMTLYVKHKEHYRLLKEFDIEDSINRLHEEMYQQPCYICPTCQIRRKPWPM